MLSTKLKDSNDNSHQVGPGSIHGQCLHPLGGGGGGNTVPTAGSSAPMSRTEPGIRTATWIASTDRPLAL